MERAEESQLHGHARSNIEDRDFEELQNAHRALRSRRVTVEADLRRHALAVAAVERAAREASREGAWARDGPETEALKDAKVQLAEVLMANSLVLK